MEKYKICYTCKKPIVEGQILYEAKLDDGKIVFAHGHPCVSNIPISKDRIPRKIGDWFSRSLGTVTSDLTLEQRVRRLEEAVFT